MRQAHAAAAMALAVVLSAGASAQDVEPFYRNRNVNLLVGTTAGGYYDIGSRVVARHIGQFIPGKPYVAVQNQPGAGGFFVVNRLLNAIERDGATFAAINRGLPQVAMTGDPKVNFDPLRLTWLGSLTSFKDDAYLMVVNSSSPVKSLADLKGPRPVHFGSTGTGSTNTAFALLANEILGVKLDVVRGFPGVAQVWLAMETGEVDGQIIDISAILIGRPAWWRDGKLRPIVAFGRKERLKQFPDVPVARELVSDPRDLALLEFAEFAFFMALPFAAPPNLPPAREQALRDAFMKMTADPGYQADIKKVGLLPSPIDGPAIVELLKQAVKTPEDVRHRFGKMLAD